jgi:hypothetical protein
MVIDVVYDRTELAVNETVRVDVTAKLTDPGAFAKQAILDLGIPPGFSVNAEDLAALVARMNQTMVGEGETAVERYELTGRQIILYLSNVTGERPLQFSYHLTANYPLRAQTPASNAYDYYNPDVNGENAPQLLTVEG